MFYSAAVQWHGKFLSKQIEQLGFGTENTAEISSSGTLGVKVSFSRVVVLGLQVPSLRDTGIWAENKKLHIHAVNAMPGVPGKTE